MRSIAVGAFETSSMRGIVFSSIAPSSLALPPEMAFQRATGGMPVHITVHRELAKQLAHLHAAAVHTPRDPSACDFVIALNLLYRMIVGTYAKIDYCLQIKLPNHVKIDNYFLRVREKFYMSHVTVFHLRFVKMNNYINKYDNASHKEGT